MFTITDMVQNAGTAAVSLQPYGIVARHGKPGDLQNFFVCTKALSADDRRRLPKPTMTTCSVELPVSNAKARMRPR
jgi:hypothetical protein